MNSINHYSNLMLNNRLRILAKTIVENGCRPDVVILEAANNIGDPLVISTLYNELFGWVGLGRGPHTGTDYQAPAYGSIFGAKKVEPPPIPKEEPEEPSSPDVEELQKNLGDAVKMLKRRGVEDKVINDLVDSAIKSATPPTLTADDFGDPVAPEADYDAGKKKRVITDPEKPDWYHEMTNAEKAWYETLTPDQKRRFVEMHYKERGFKVRSDGSGVLGHLDVPPDEHDQVHRIADGIRSRNKDITHPDAWKRAAGIWNRHKIRQKMAGKIRAGRKGTPLTGGFEDLLHKDHRKHEGDILGEWCLLAGIELKKSKGN